MTARNTPLYAARGDAPNHGYSCGCKYENGSLNTSNCTQGH